MANWLSKITSAPPVKTNGRSAVPSARRMGAARSGALPNASIIYGVAAGAFFAVALVYLFTKAWFTGLLLLLPAVGFAGFALHFIRHPH